MTKAERIKTDEKRRAKHRLKWAKRDRLGKPARGHKRNERRIAEGKTVRGMQKPNRE